MTSGGIDVSFNLVDEPWIRVRRGQDLTEVGLRDALRNAHHHTGLAGDVPTQDVAILRVLLAILYRAHVEDTGIELWTDLQSREDLATPKVEAYLDTWHHRFDLIDSETPFMQVAGLTAAKTSGLAKMVADVPDGFQYFTTRAGDALQSMSFGEAARWLVHAHAYDPSGIKTGAVGDDRVTGGKGYPIGTGWAGKCGLLLLEGHTLKDTLLLNFPQQDWEDLDRDRPVWEREPLGPGVERGHVAPDGPADLYTWQSRRLRLFHDGERVRDVLLTNGDRLEPQNRHRLERMSAWQRSSNQERALKKKPVYMPVRHYPARALWRGLDGFLVRRDEGGAQRGGAAERIAPGTLEWVRDLLYEGDLPADTPIRLRGVGIRYGTQEASIEAMYDDSLTVRAALVGDERLQHLAREAAHIGSEVAREIGSLAGNIAAAGGTREVDGDRERARELAYHAIGGEFGRWVSTLGSGTDVDGARTEWQRCLRTSVRPLENALVDAAGTEAVLGRPDPRDTKRMISVALAQGWFTAKLRTLLPAAFETDTTRRNDEQ